MKHIDFNNTEVAFAYRNKRDLIRAYNMFYLMKYNWLVKVGTDVTMKVWDRGVTKNQGSIRKLIIALYGAGFEAYLNDYLLKPLAGESSH